jgi:hypothetical protein
VLLRLTYLGVTNALALLRLMDAYHDVLTRLSRPYHGGAVVAD